MVAERQVLPGPVDNDAMADFMAKMFEAISPSNREQHSRGPVPNTRSRVQKESAERQNERQSMDQQTEGPTGVQNVRQGPEQGASCPDTGARTSMASMHSPSSEDGGDCRQAHAASSATHSTATLPPSCDHEGKGSYQRRGSDIAVTRAPASLTGEHPEGSPKYVGSGEAATPCYLQRFLTSKCLTR